MHSTSILTITLTLRYLYRHPTGSTLSHFAVFVWWGHSVGPALSSSSQWQRPYILTPYTFVSWWCISPFVPQAHFVKYDYTGVNMPTPRQNYCLLVFLSNIRPTTSHNPPSPDPTHPTNKKAEGEVGGSAKQETWRHGIMSRGRHIPNFNSFHSSQGRSQWRPDFFMKLFLYAFSSSRGPQIRELISIGKTSHKHSSKDGNSRLWHTSKYGRYINSSRCAPSKWAGLA